MVVTRVEDITKRDDETFLTQGRRYNCVSVQTSSFLKPGYK